jgi:nucleoside-diphosphate-sugar epimerase
MASSNLHVIFGTGPLGIWTARTLLAAGQRVRMVNRSGQSAAAPQGAELVRGDAYDTAQTRELTRGAVSIYQCSQPAYHQWAKHFPRMQASLMAAAAANQAKLIAAENVYMYGDPQGQPLRESSPYRAHTRKGRVRQAMTEQLFAAHQRGELRATSLRGSDFFGPEDLIWSRLLFQPALQGKSVNLIGRLDQAHTFTYAPDFGRALAIAGMNDAALGRPWHVPSAPAITQQQLIDLIAAVVNKPVKPLMAGGFLLRAIGLFNPTINEMVEMLYEWIKPFVVESNDFTAQFGMQPTPIAEAVRATLEWNQTRLAAKLLAAHT